MLQHAVCQISDVPDPGCKEFSHVHQDEQIEGFILHWQGNWYGYRNRCPHTRAPLNWLPDQFFDSEDRYLICSLHGATFEPDTGLCIYGPCLGESLQALSVQVIGEQLFVEI